MKEKIRRCVYCGCTEILFLTQDHIVPKVRGGPDTPDNLQDCCWSCNQIKGGLTHKELLDYRQALRILKRLKKIRIIYNQRISIPFYQEYTPEQYIKGVKE